MIALFNFAPEDKSVQYLQQIFGTMNGIITNPSAGAGESGAGSIASLSVMFKTFNSAILAVAVILIVYTTVVGVMKTAGEGEFMGKNWQSLWVPIRVVLGIAALVPFGSGYSAIQMIMMWVIMQGIGAADTLWSTVLGYVQVAGSPYAQIQLPDAGTTQTLSNLFKGLVCDAAARVEKGAPGNTTEQGAYYCNTTIVDGKQTNPWCRQAATFNPDATSFALGPNKACGTLTYCDQNAVCKGTTDNSLSCLSCRGQVKALQTIIPTLQGVAQQLVDTDYAYRDFYVNSARTKGSWSFMYSYCSDNSISQDKCCVPPIFPSSPKEASCAGGGFPKPDLQGGAGSDPRNPSDQAVKDIYWPYALVPSVGKDDFIQTSVFYYMNELQSALTTYITDQGQNHLEGDLKSAYGPGWIYGGAYYYIVSRTNSNNLNEAMPIFTMTLFNDMNSTSMGMSRNDMQAAAILAVEAANAAQQSSAAKAGINPAPTSSLAGIEGMGDLSSAVNNTNESNSQVFAQTVTPSGTNPLSAIQTAGAALLLSVTILYPILLDVSVALGFTTISFFAVGNGVVNPLSAVYILVYFFLMPAMFALMGILTILGGMLAVYVPLIPFVIFSFGAIGWMISTIEAMVAGPIVALGILNPYGQHEILGSASGALMLLFNIFLRPSLMIFGLVAAMLLATITAAMVSYTFWIIVVPTGIFNGASGMGGILEFIIVLCAYVTLLVAVLNKSFMAISVIPSQVIRWIGGHAEHGGEEEGVRAMKAGTEAGAAGIKGGMEAGERQAKAATQAVKEQQKGGGGPSLGGGGGGGAGGGGGGAGGGGGGTPPIPPVPPGVG